MKKIALVTGASSGIGREIAMDLSLRGFELILVARRKERLEELQTKLKRPSEIFVADLSKKEDCYKVYDTFKDRDILVLVNNAGFGAVGDFTEIPLERELEMIDTNCRAVHILTKLFLGDFVKRNKGYILNVASSAGLLSGGPMMSTYYATKSYVTSLTCGINEELKHMRSNVSVSALCPGPVDTEFNDVANAKFGVSSISAEQCARYGVEKMFERTMLIVPKLSIKAGVIAGKIMPTSMYLKIANNIQGKKLR